MAPEEQRDEIDEEIRAAQFERLYGTVRVELVRGRVDSAARAAAELLAGWPDSTTAHELTGDVAQARGDQEMALAEYGNALKLEPVNGDARHKFTAIVTAGTPERAAALTEKLLAELPESSLSHELLADVLLMQSKPREALAEYEKARELGAASPDAERKYAALRLRSGDADRRKALLAAAVANPSQFTRKKRAQPIHAVLLGLAFPGFGQVYNDDYIKGAVLFAGGTLALILLLSMLVFSPYEAVVRAHSAHPHHISLSQQLSEVHEALASFGVVQWALVFLAGAALTALYVYGVWDAYTVAKRKLADADPLGVG